MKITAICAKHGCTMIIRYFQVGWGEESKEVCPECEKEIAVLGKPAVILSESRSGW